MGVKTEDRIYHYDKNGKYVDTTAASGKDTFTTEQVGAIFKKGIKSLGYHITKNSYKIYQDSLRSLDNIKIPKSVKQVQKFFDFTNCL